MGEAVGGTGVRALDSASDSWPWEVGPAAPVLVGDEVHLWLAELDLPDAEVESLGRVLSEAERARAAKFKFERDRRRWAVSRGILRTLLARYVDVAAEDLQLVEGAGGKPQLDCPGNSARDIQFNLSHSGDLCLYAVALGKAVGVDLEKIREDVEADTIARQFFTAREAKMVAQAKGEARANLFARLWTCKEAFLKATSSGLGKGMNGFEIHLEKEAWLADAAGKKMEGWELREIGPVAGYAAAVVLEGHAFTVRSWRWR